MFKELAERCDAIEECYEYMLAFAGQGLPGEADGAVIALWAAPLRRARRLSKLAGREARRARPERCRLSWDCWRGCAGSLAAIEIVLAQSLISSQLIDNLGIHLCAMLTDLFLIDEIIRLRRSPPACQHN
jgi:hypothetical protein